MSWGPEVEGPEMNRPEVDRAEVYWQRSLARRIDWVWRGMIAIIMENRQESRAVRDQENSEEKKA